MCQPMPTPSGVFHRFTLLHHNIHSFTSHRDTLYAHLSALQFPMLVALTETWSDTSVPAITLPR